MTCIDIYKVYESTSLFVSQSHRASYNEYTVISLDSADYIVGEYYPAIDLNKDPTLTRHKQAKSIKMIWTIIILALIIESGYSKGI